jgi:hypothetical protein
MQIQYLSKAEIDSLADGISEVFAMSSSMKYVPLNNRTQNGNMNRYGETEFTYNEAGKFAVYGCMESSANLDPDLDRGAGIAKHRVEGILKLVFRDVINNGYQIINGDAVDILNEYGVWTRWVIFGEESRVELPYIITRLAVVRSDTLTSG